MLQELLGEQDRYYDAVLRDKYAKGAERTTEDVYRRVARGLAEAEKPAERAKREEEFLQAMIGGFCPAGRIMSAAGTDIQATLINCFVQPVGDSVAEVRDGRVGIYTALLQAAETMRRGGGVGYDFSAIRPRGARVAGTQSRASGPISYMRVFDRSCETVESAGARRGAQMGVLRVDHPDILEFIRAKDVRATAQRLRAAGLSGRELDQQLQSARTLSNFNLSVAVTDEFMRRKAEGGEVELVHAAEPDPAEHPDARRRDDGLWVYRRVPALELWDEILRMTYDTADPGVVFMDRMNRENNLGWCEKLEATNPCVTADTRLHTQHGLVRIGDLHQAGAELQVTVDRRALGGAERGTETRTALPAFMTVREADVFRVTTEDGHEIKATAWHDFYTERGKLPLSDLKIGDAVLVQSGKGQFGTEGSEPLGLILGLITGDGHITNRGGDELAAVINLWNEERALAGRIALYVNALIAGIALNARTYAVTPVAVPERNMVFLRSVLLMRVLTHYGFTQESKHRVPEVVWRGAEDCVKGYLRGLFQTDGTVNVSSNSLSCSVRLASSWPELLRDVQMLLANFGVFSRIRLRRKAGLRNLPDGKGGQRAYACQSDHELIVDGESRERFMREIGFLLPAKRQRYEAWVQDKVLRKTQRFTSRIRAIEYVGREAVYDTTQPDHNTVIFNGLVTGQCGEQPLPSYGCCCLGSLNLARLVVEPFTEAAHLDWARLRALARTAVRMLDNVLDVTRWPLPEQRREAQDKRRLGLGFTGLGTALMMLRIRYGSEEGMAIAAQIARELRDAAYRASVELARERGAFPLLDVEQYLATPFVRRLPEDLRAEIRTHGIRNSHLLSIAPTGTISLAFGRNVTGGIEPAFAWEYTRRTRDKTGASVEYPIQDYGYRLYLGMGGDRDNLPAYFANAQTLAPPDHLRMQAAVQPFVDSAISKTVNCPVDISFEDFKRVYDLAYEWGCKGCTTYRPNDVTGAVLSVPRGEAAHPTLALEPLPLDRRLRLEKLPAPPLASLKWPSRPEFAKGNPAWTYLVDAGPGCRFAVFVGHVDNDQAGAAHPRGDRYPFEVWVNGAEQPRGLGATAKLLSMDMRSRDRAWLKLKLEALIRTKGNPVPVAMPPSGETIVMASPTAALARLVQLRCQELGAFDQPGASPVIDALLSAEEPVTGTDGTMSWTVDVKNPATGDDAVVVLKELQMPDGQRRPYAVGLYGDYPRDLDGLCRLLSLDMRIVDPAWIGAKLRKLRSYPETGGAFLGRVPGQTRSQLYASTVAYLAALMLHRYHMLGILDEDGAPLKPLGVLESPAAARSTAVLGAPCPDCGAHAVVRHEGCQSCTSCGWIGNCG